MKTFNVVPHSHLDREWYRTLQENRIKLIRFMDDLFETMEKDPTYLYYELDAQTSFIDDYFDVKPENLERFRRLIQEGRLIIGPWYVQPDEHLPTAEGTIRNLLISRKISDRFGDFGKVAYVPDSFGQSATFPSLMSGFGLKSAIMYRGFAEDDSKYNDFIWEGLDGSRLIANWMPVGYGNAMFLREDDDAKNIEVVEENIELLEERSVSENYLLMCGSDQSFVKKFLPNTVNRLNELFKDKQYTFKLSNLQHYIDAISLHADKMEVVRGELRKGKRSRTHNSIGATRMDIKITNFESEMKYLKVLEPLSSMMACFGLETDLEIINRGWKYIVENHAHDSICCCCTDDIHREILMRMMFANQTADYLIKEKLEALNQRVNFNLDLGRPVLIFSSYIGRRKEQIEVDVYVKSMEFVILNSKGKKLEFEVLSSTEFNLKDTKVSFTPIPDDYYHQVKVRVLVEMFGFGYDTIYVKEGHTNKLAEGAIAKGSSLENDYLRLDIEDDGSWTVFDKLSQITYKNQHVFVDDGNAGDEYDYSPSFNDQRFSSIGCMIDKEVVENTSLKGALHLKYSMMVPKTTNNDKRSDELVELTFDVNVSLERDKSYFNIKTTINNQVENHRIQVLFDLCKRVKTNFADIQLGEIERENEFELTDVSVRDQWHERYYPVFNQHKYSGLKDETENGFIVLNKGLPQYEIYQEETTKLAITLLSCVGAMGNVGLKYRPGRRSGSADLTPDSQMKGVYTLEYAFMLIQANSEYRLDAEKYVNPIVGIAFPEFSNEGNLPDNLTLISSEDGLLLSCLKPSEVGDGFILRTLNPSTQSIKHAEVKVNRFLFNSGETVNLAEEKVDDKRVTSRKLNNPDGSAMAQFSGVIELTDINRNQLVSVLLKK
jgi:mannosylglycerate hydrolase